MTQDEFVEHVEFDLAALRRVVDEVDKTLGIATNDPGALVTNAVGAFLQSFYNGIENVLKRFCLYHGVPLPQGERYHADLLDLFSPESAARLPNLLDAGLSADLERFRQFRHVFRTSYGFQLDWSRMSPGAATARSVLDRFEAAVRSAF